MHPYITCMHVEHACLYIIPMSNMQCILIKHACMSNMHAYTSYICRTCNASLYNMHACRTCMFIHHTYVKHAMHPYITFMSKIRCLLIFHSCRSCNACLKIICVEHAMHAYITSISNMQCRLFYHTCRT